MKDKNDNTVRISVRLSEGEKELLERSAKLCGLSQSEFVRQLCKGKHRSRNRQRSFGNCLKHSTMFTEALRSVQSMSLPH